MRGKLVVFEGVDGAGKTTQVAELARFLRACWLPVVTTKEPTNGPWGRRIRETAVTGRLSVEEELELFERDRKEHVETLIRPRLEEGSWVLVDRYYYSTAAYQGIRGLDPGEIIERNERFAPRPDLLLLLDVPADVGVARVRERDSVENAFEKLEDLAQCRTLFLAMTGPHVVVVPATQPPVDVTRDILRAVLDRLLRSRMGERSEELLRGMAPEDAGWVNRVRQALHDEG